jgi:hypothetical protein
MFELCGIDTDGLGVHRLKKAKKTPEEQAAAKVAAEAKKQAAAIMQPEAFDWKPWLIGGAVAFVALGGLLYVVRR